MEHFVLMFNSSGARLVCLDYDPIEHTYAPMPIALNSPRHERARQSPAFAALSRLRGPTPRLAETGERTGL